MSKVLRTEVLEQGKILCLPTVKRGWDSIIVTAREKY